MKLELEIAAIYVTHKESEMDRIIIQIVPHSGPPVGFLTWVEKGDGESFCEREFPGIPYKVVS